MQTIDTIIFDFDGTLVDTSEDIASAINAMRRNFGLRSLDLETIMMCIGKSAKNLVSLCLTNTKVDFEKGYEFFKNYYCEHLCEKSVLYPGVYDMLQKCRKEKVKMAIVSNKPRISICKICETLEIDAFFEVILGIDSFDFYKPDPRIAIKALNSIGSKPENTIIIGDHSVDIEMASRAGIRSVFLMSGFSCMISDNIKPTYIVKNMLEISKILFGEKND